MLVSADVLIRVTGEIVYSNAQGVTSVDSLSAQPVSADTVFWIASCTKLMTTIAALQCIERGLLNLDDGAALAKILPEYGAPEVLSGFEEDGSPRLAPAKNKITMRAMLTHTSGMGYEFLSPKLQKWKEFSKAVCTSASFVPTDVCRVRPNHFCLNPVRNLSTAYPWTSLAESSNE